MIVIDASAVVDALVDDPADPELLALIADAELHAPSLIDYEVASALRGHALGGLLPQARLEEALDDFRALQVTRYQLTSMIGEVVALRDSFTAYDAAYVVLAQALAAPLVTADDKLRAARSVGVDVRVIR